MKSYLVAFGLLSAVLAPVVGAHAAAAEGPTATITMSCTAVTFAYRSFPNATNTIDTEQVTVEPTGPILAVKAFTFTGQSATDTIPISGVTNGETINGSANWTDPAPGGEPAVIQAVNDCGGPGPCPLGTKINVRWHYRANGSSGSWSGTKGVGCPGPLLVGPQAMEGDLKVVPGTTLSAGYDFTVPGNTQPLSLSVGGPQVVFAVGCVSGATPSSTILTVAMPTATYTVNDSQWYPSGDQHSSLVYEGSVIVPDVCGGGALRLNHGGTFSASIS